MAPNTRPSSSDWDVQKDTIRQLYLGQDLKRQEVQVQMEKLGLVATKAQYEAKFKEWGFSKNVPVITWKHVGFKIEKRKRDNKDSTVSINGVEVSAKRVKKETSRHFYSFTERAELEKNNALSPPGPLTVVDTPPSSQAFPLIDCWPTDLPWFSFIRFLDKLPEGLPRSQLNPHTFHAELPATQKGAQTKHVLDEMDHRTSNEEVWQHIIKNIKQYKLADLNQAVLPFSSEIRWPADIQPSKSLESMSSSHWSLKVLLYLASNKLLDYYNLQLIWQMIEDAGIRQLPNFSNSPYGRDTTLAAAMECLFEPGIHRRHIELVSWLLDTGIEPNTKIKLESAETGVHLALIAAMSSNRLDGCEMVQLLLSKGSSPVLICCEEHGSPIQFLLWNYKEEEHDRSRWLQHEASNMANLRSFWSAILRIMETWDLPLSTMANSSYHESPDLGRLIELVETVATRTSEPGASAITPRSLIRAVEKNDENFVKFVHNRGLKMDCCDEDGRFPLLAALETSRSPGQASVIFEETYLSNVKLLLNLGASVNYSPFSQPHGSCSLALQAAIHNIADCFKLIDVIELLVKHGAHVRGQPTCGEEDHLTLADCVRYKDRWFPYHLAKVLITLHHAGLPLPEWSLISVLELAFENNDYDWQNELYAEYGMLIKASPGTVDLSLRSERGWTALDYATVMKEHELEKILVEHGAKHTRTWVYSQCLHARCSTARIEILISRLPTPQRNEKRRDSLFYLIHVLRTSDPTNQNSEDLLKSLHESCTISKNSKRDAYTIEAVCRMGQAQLITTTFKLLPGIYSSTALTTLIESEILSIQDRWEFVQQLLERRQRAGAYLAWSDETRMFAHTVRGALEVGGDTGVLEWFQRNDEKAFEHANLHPSSFAIKVFDVRKSKKQWVKPNIIQWLKYDLKISSYLGLLVIYSGQVENMRTILDQNFRPNRRIPWSLTALQLAVAQANRPMTLQLLKARCDVNARPPWRDIPIAISKRIPHEIQNVLNYHQKQTRRRTALQLAVEIGDYPIIKLLVEYGADVNGPPARVGGATALQLACIKGYIEIVRFLLSKEADVNASGAEYFGRTALEGAAENGRLDIVRFLLERDCRIDGSCRRQYIRAVGFARARGHYILSETIQSFGKWSDVDEDLLKQIDLYDVEPSSRDLEEHLHNQEEDDISEVDAADVGYGSQTDYDSNSEDYDNDSDDYESISDDEDATPSANCATQEISSVHHEEPIRPLLTDEHDWDKLLDYFGDDELETDLVLD